MSLEYEFTEIPACADEIVRFGVFAADMEALNPRPISPIRNPDGSAQRETAAEFTRRIVSTAVLHLIEVGLLVVPDDIDERLSRPIPLDRPRPVTR